MSLFSYTQSETILENHLTVELIESLNKGLPEGEFIWGYYVRVFGGQVQLEHAKKTDRCYWGQFSDYAGECVPAESFVFNVVDDRVCILSYENPQNSEHSYYGKVVLPTKELATDFVSTVCAHNKQMNNGRILTNPIREAFAASPIGQMRGPPMTEYNDLLAQLTAKNSNEVTGSDRQHLAEIHQKCLQAWQPVFIASK